MAVKVDEHISSLLSLKTTQVPKSTPVSEVEIFETIFHFIPFPLCAHFHNRCEASRSSLQMKCKIGEPGPAITIKAKVGERGAAGAL